MKTQTFGIEMEFNNISRARAAQVIAEHFGTSVEYRGGTYDTRRVRDNQGRYWKVVSDSSITAPYEEQTEVVSPICRWEDIPMVQKIVRELRHAGAKAHRSCGIHVHVGLGNHSAKTLRNLVNIINAKGRFYVHINLDGLMRGDYKSRMEGYAIARQNGWLSANDIRDLENLNPISDEEGGNAYLINGNMIPISLAGSSLVNSPAVPAPEPTTADPPGDRRKRK